MKIDFSRMASSLLNPAAMNPYKPQPTEGAARPEVSGGRTAPSQKCFACGRPIKSKDYKPDNATAADEQTVCVGPECHKQITKGGALGYQPPKGGPRLYLPEHKPK